MTIKLKILDSASFPSWDENLKAFSKANVFHTSAWAKTLMEAYRYEPNFAAWYEGDTPVALAPVMEVRSVLTGTRGVSLPFTDVCPLLSRGKVSDRKVKEGLIRLGRSKGWKTLETRGLLMEARADEAAVPQFYLHELDLAPGKEQLLAQVRSSTRRNIRKSQKLDVRVEEANTMEGLREFVRLNSLTRRDHGLPPQPNVFFQSLYRNLIQPGMGRILLAVHDDQCIASSVFLNFNGNAIYKYGASDRRYQSLRANNLIMWEAISSYSDRGYRTFNFGRTESGNSGLLQFKRGWGASEEPFEYSKFDFARDTWINESASASGVHTHLFSRMPLFALSLLGRILYRHMG